jgi:prepilin-type N-terminal cleavage/methylation domain-containing protein
MSWKWSAERGYSLAELLFVLVVLAVIAAITTPPAQGRGARRLERAGAEVAAALDFARAEAMRTGVPHGVRARGGGRISVFRLDRSVIPPAERYDVRHPVDKSLYDLDLSADLYTQGTTATGWFLFQRDGTAAQAATFDAHGEPIRGDDARPLATGGVLLGNEGYSLAVSVAPLVGRTTAGAAGGAIADPADAFPAPVEP